MLEQDDRAAQVQEAQAIPILHLKVASPCDAIRTIKPTGCAVYGWALVCNTETQLFVLIYCSQ